ncbi:MAG TPA: hypothetical protein VNA67_05980 [Pseudonocardiaceae bacterium]|nr:hypothetical protein [Pseudonocardiaceae bacterium]
MEGQADAERAISAPGMLTTIATGLAPSGALSTPEGELRWVRVPIQLRDTVDGYFVVGFLVTPEIAEVNRAVQTLALGSTHRIRPQRVVERARPRALAPRPHAPTQAEFRGPRLPSWPDPRQSGTPVSRPAALAGDARRPSDSSLRPRCRYYPSTMRSE